MIKEKEIDLRVNNNMVKYYEKKLNMNLITGQIIKINVNDLSTGSHAKITCVCDKCGYEKIMIYKEYHSVTRLDEENKYYCTKCSKIKKNKTMKDKYGFEHALQSDTFKNKAKDTWLKNYGVDHPAKCKTVKDKFNKTMLERYNVENALENEEILNSMKKNLFNEYGMYFVETDEFKEKSKLTCLKRYGVENASQTDDFQRKRGETCIKKYGFEYYFQNSELFHNYLISSFKMKKYKETDLYYQGTYEKDFLELCEKLNILDTVKRGCTIRYNMNDKNLIYFPDFFIEKQNMLIEIKSSYWYNVHKEKNLIKEKTCRELEFDYFLILDKNYDEFLNKIRF